MGSGSWFSSRGRTWLLVALWGGMSLALSGCGAPDFAATHKAFADFYKEQQAALDANRFNEAEFKARRDEFEAKIREVEQERKGNIEMTPDELAAFKELIFAQKHFNDRWFAALNSQQAADLPTQASESLPERNP